MKFTKEDVLSMVGACFDMFASSHILDAKEAANAMMERRENDQKVREHIDSVLPDEPVNNKRLKCDDIASQLFYNKFDCYLMDDFLKTRTIPAMTEQKFREIVGKLIYDKS